LKNPTEKILSAGFFYPLEKSLACGTGAFGATPAQPQARGGRQGRLCFLQRIYFKETKSFNGFALNGFAF
jgi:hypothetical protein